MPGHDGSTEFEFDVAVSFAGEDRELVVQIVEQLKAAEVRVFYDDDFKTDTWGEDLIEYFDGVYRQRSRYAVLFISHHYAEKPWTRHERRSALARAIQERQAYVLPVQLDDTELPGLPPTVGHLDARVEGADGIVESIIGKLHGTRVEPRPIERVPRSEAERQRILLDRPPGWEYLYFAGCLQHFLDEGESTFIDHEMRYAAQSSQRVEPGTVLEFMTERLDEVLSLMAGLERIMRPEVQDRAMGEPGEPGDPVRIRQLAVRWNDHYLGLIDWAGRVRGVTISSDYAELLEALAQYVDQPIHSYRAFVRQFVDSTHDLPARLRAGEHIEMELTYLMTVPDEVSAAYDAELRRLNEGGLI